MPLFNEELSGTCHRVLYTKFDNTTHNQELIIIDEFSMVDFFILKDIVEWCRCFSCRLVIIGDENQLPSINHGTCLKNMIESNIFSQTKLDEIKRQDGLLMTNIKKMTNEILCKSDMIDETMTILSIRDFIRESDKLLCPFKIKQLFFDENFTMENTKVLTYFKDEKYLCNMNNLNNIFQTLFNPNGLSVPSPKTNYKSKSKSLEIEYREGDVIIRTENDYSSEVFRANGECARIISYDRGNVRIEYLNVDNVKSKEVVSIQTLYDEFTLAYALTVHKSQGSEYENVVMFIDEKENSWNKRALYTGVSRSQKKCVIITREEDFICIQKRMKRLDDKVSLFLKESSVYELS